MSARMVGKGNDHTRSAALLAAFVAPFVGLGVIFMVSGVLGMSPSIGFMVITFLVSFAVVFAIDYAKSMAYSKGKASNLKVISVSEHLDIAA